MMNILWILCPVIAFGAFVDSIAGGGGLITLTAYAAVGLPPQAALANNKFSSSAGTFIATFKYFQKSQISLAIGTIAVIFSFLGSSIGSALAARYAATYLYYLLLFLVPALSLFMLFKPDFGQGKERSKGFGLTLGAISGLVVGAYDGFFGPGTGMFFTIIFTSVLGLDLLKACGTARVVNFASNIAALMMFLLHGFVDFSIAIPCAVSAVIGSYIGSSLALKVGAKVVKPVMFLVLSLLLIKVAFEVF